jgi:phosphatidate cytidylyltransferase
MERTWGLVGGVLVVLAIATAVAQVLKRRADHAVNPAIVETFRRRVRAWWLLTALLAATLLIGQTATVVLFAVISFWALREFITLTPTRPGDHRTLFWVFFLVTPLQFVLVGLERYGLYAILIPVYVFLFVPTGIALSDDPKRFLERIAKVQAGLLICVYCLSFAAAQVTLPIPAADVADLPWFWEEGAQPVEAPRDVYAGARLLFFFVLMVQLSDALQYAWSQLPSKHVIAPSINPTKTWEGLLAGTATVTLIGAALWWATPFRYWLAGLMSMVIALMGFAGSMTMSAIKRDRGVKDFGTLVTGHGGVLDRLDSICFAAPVFFHFTRYYLILKNIIPPVV